MAVITWQSFYLKRKWRMTCETKLELTWQDKIDRAWTVNTNTWHAEGMCSGLTASMAKTKSQKDYKALRSVITCMCTCESPQLRPCHHIPSPLYSCFLNSFLPLPAQSYFVLYLIQANKVLALFLMYFIVLRDSIIKHIFQQIILFNCFRRIFNYLKIIR